MLWNPRRPTRQTAREHSEKPALASRVADTIRSKASHTPFVALFERVIQTFHQLHSALQKFWVRYSLPGPTLQYAVYAEAFLAAEFLVGQVGIMNDFGNHFHRSLSDSEVFLERFESTVV